MFKISFLLHDFSGELIMEQTITCHDFKVKQLIRETILYLTNFYGEDYDIGKIEIKKEYASYN